MGESPSDRLASLAKRRLPRVAFDFVDGGAEDEVTMRRNRVAFDELALVPRVLRGVAEVSTETTLFGQRMRLPVLLAPAGAGLVAGPDAYRAAAAGAAAAGTISVLGAAGAEEAEAVAAASSQPQWLQLYLTRDRTRLVDALERAKRCGFTALVLTGDTPVAGNRERDVRNGLTVPLRIVTPRIVFGALCRPRWTWRYLGGRRRGKWQSVGSRVRELQTLAESVRAALNPEQSWDDLRWLRSLWDGPLLLKGVMCAEDAELAVEAGCDGVIVSNHGGRQLDGAPASIEMLPEVVAALNGRAEVLLDSGVRRGTDVVKALSLGAKACLVGRPWIFAVVTSGQRGVVDLLDQLQREIDVALHLVGVSSPADLAPGCVRCRAGGIWQRFESLEVPQ